MRVKKSSQENKALQVSLIRATYFSSNPPLGVSIHFIMTVSLDFFFLYQETLGMAESHPVLVGINKLGHDAALILDLCS